MPWRSSQYLWGLSFLTKKLQTKVEVANKLMEIALRICRTLLKFKVPFFLENPATSRVWHAAEVSKLVEAGAAITTIDQCMYGSPWRKATSFLCGNIDPVDRDAFSKQCQGQHCYWRRTGEKHVNLEGGHMTAKSQQYPATLCNKIANLLTSNLSMDACNARY